MSAPGRPGDDGTRRASAPAAWRTRLRTGLLAGAAVGLLDTAWAVVRGVGGLAALASPPARAIPSARPSAVPVAARAPDKNPLRGSFMSAS